MGPFPGGGFAVAHTHAHPPFGLLSLCSASSSRPQHSSTDVSTCSSFSPPISFLISLVIRFHPLESTFQDLPRHIELSILAPELVPHLTLHHICPFIAAFPTASLAAHEMDEHSSSMATQTQTQTPESFNNPSKRKRSVSVERPNLSAPPQKAAKTHNSHLQINYLVRQYSDTLPLISVDDTLPSILQLVSDYHGALERHESLAGNLGARLLGPILIKRFERLFDGPPTVLKCHGKEGTTVTWLDVVEFARHKPEQFNLEKMHDNARVCQFYTKQSRVEISEEDYLLIASGMPQKLIPPQPIAEDEEKELGTLEILEKNMGAVIQLTDQGTCFQPCFVILGHA